MRIARIPTRARTQPQPCPNSRKKVYVPSLRRHQRAETLFESLCNYFGDVWEGKGWGGREGRRGEERRQKEEAAAPPLQVPSAAEAHMHAVRRCCRRTSATATRTVAKEQPEMHVPLPHEQEKVTPGSSDIRGEALAGQRRGNIRRRPEVLGRAEPTSSLVEQSLGPVSYRASPV